MKGHRKKININEVKNKAIIFINTNKQCFNRGETKIDKSLSDKIN